MPQVLDHVRKVNAVERLRLERKSLRLDVAGIPPVRLAAAPVGRLRQRPVDRGALEFFDADDRQIGPPPADVTMNAAEIPAPHIEHLGVR